MHTPLPTEALLAWFGANRRDLPWRRQPDPYRVWLSEIMAQQTRIAAMLPYYERFLARWPTVQDLAAAELHEVLAAWSGLGYYSRARNLHAAAKVAAKGGFPSDAAGLRALPGVGEYTAAAIASIAWGEDVALMDGNVERVLCRFHGVVDDPRKPKVKTALKALVAADLPKGRAGDYNQALMELGALVCTPRSPRCGECPLRAACRVPGERLPHRPRVDRSPEVRGVCGALVVGERVLLARRPESGLLGGLYELPGVDLEEHADEATALTEALDARLGLAVRPARREGQVRHIFTHRKLTLGVWRVETPEPTPLVRSYYLEFRWASVTELDSLPLSTLARRALELVGFGGQVGLFAAEPPAQARGG